jgi:hypothetical protein
MAKNIPKDLELFAGVSTSSALSPDPFDGTWQASEPAGGPDCASVIIESTLHVPALVQHVEANPELRI